jgi:hypothetical protein
MIPIVSASHATTEELLWRSADNATDNSIKPAMTKSTHIRWKPITEAMIAMPGNVSATSTSAGKPDDLWVSILASYSI